MSFPGYEKYKDSGVDWLREVPENWGLVQVKRLFARRKELNTGMTCEERLSLTMSGVIPRSLEDLDGLQASEFETYQIFKKDDLVFKLIDLQNIKTSRVGIVPYMGIMSPAYIRLEPDDKKVIPKYGYWFFTDMYNRHIFNQLGGGVRQTLGPEELLSLSFSLPSVKEQASIADFLDVETSKIDELIAEQEKLIELLKEKRQAIISHAVTKGLNPKAPMKPSGIDWLGDVPAHWEITKLKYIAQFSGGGTPSRDNPDYWNGNIPWVSPKDVKQDFISETTEYITALGLSSSSTNLVDKGRVLVVVRSGILQHTIPVALNRVPVALNQDMKAILLKTDKFLARFFQLWVQGLNDVLLRAWSKQGATVESIEHQYMADSVLLLPPMDEQHAIITHLQAELQKIEHLTAASRQSVDLLQERRTALISAAVTGKIDVRGVVKKGKQVAA